MALPAVSVMPAARWRSYAFEIERVDYLAPTVGGRVGGVTAGWPLFRLEVEPSHTTELQSETWSAWVDSLRGQQRHFLAGPERRFPLAHPSGLPGGHSGDATSWSVNTDRDVLTLTGMPSTLSLTPGDFVGFRWTTAGAPRGAVVKVMEAGTGTTPAVTVEPAVPRIVPGSAVAYLVDPKCLMRQAPDTKVGPLGSTRTKAISFAAIQTLLA